MAERGPDRGVVVIGAGGHARVCIELLRSAGFAVAGIVGSPSGLPTGGPPREELLGAPILGADDAALPGLFARGHTRAFVALGDNRARLASGERLRGLGFTLVTAVHPSATISPSAWLGDGAAVMAGAVVNACTMVGALAVVNTRAAVDHDGVLAQACHIGPGATLAGTVTVGERAFVGVGASVVQKVSIGADTQVGAGAAVVGDLPAGVLAYGVPARVVRPL